MHKNMNVVQEVPTVYPPPTLSSFVSNTLLDNIKTVSPTLVLQLLYIFSKNWCYFKLYNAQKTLI